MRAELENQLHHDIRSLNEDEIYALTPEEQKMVKELKKYLSQIEDLEELQPPKDDPNQIENVKEALLRGLRKEL